MNSPTEMSLSDEQPDRPIPFRQPAPDEPQRSADSELFIRKAFEGNPVIGLELLFRRYYPAMHSQATRIVVSRHIADDVVSDVFLNFWQKRCYEQVTTSFRAYLMASVRHEALLYLRREFADEPLPLDTVYKVASTQPSADQLLMYDELSLRIDAAIRTMPPQGQRVFLLRRFEAKTNAQIAEQLCISIRTVEVHLYRATRLLKAIIAER